MGAHGISADEDARGNGSKNGILTGFREPHSLRQSFVNNLIKEHERTWLIPRPLSIVGAVQTWTSTADIVVPFVPIVLGGRLQRRETVGLIGIG